jgi:hypothetical protein
MLFCPAMDGRVLLSLPLALASSGCALSARLGPEVRSQAPGAVLEGRGTVIAALGGASGGHGTQLGIPVSFSKGVRLRDGGGEGTFESGLEYTSVGERFGFRSGVRLGMQLGEATGGYAGVRGGPVLMLSPAREGHGAPALTLEGLAGIGLGGTVAERPLLGACLTIDFDYYSKFDLRLPSGRPFRCDDGDVWRGSATLGRRRSPSLGRALPAAEREHIGLEYLEDALDERASVPAFERLAFELTVHEAPRTLVARARAAAVEERHHATICFALAAAYLGRDATAPELPHPRLRLARPRAEIARESFWDGCVGEAKAAQALLDRAARAGDRRERRALSGIARDEAGHARLAASVVAWAASRA